VLLAVAATSPANAWAVGTVDYEHTLILHWNGSVWRRQPSPNPKGGKADELEDVAATSPTDAWAVGSHQVSDPAYGGGPQRIIEHWNGKAWKAVPSPAFGSAFSRLSGVTAFSVSDAWAVGYTEPAGCERTLIEHWNGTAWTVWPTRVSGGLGAITATSPTDVWAVGTRCFNGTPSFRTLIMHWNGTAWKAQTNPNPHEAELDGVAAASPTNAWAVGSYKTPKSSAQTLVEHWNGKSWKLQRSPNPAGSFQPNSLNAVTATSATNAWAVGMKAGRGKHPPQTLIEHWNGNAWSPQPAPSPNPGPPNADYGIELNDITATTPTHAWAVGNTVSDQLILQWNGAAWKG
jgi:hypothetical protein